MAPGAVGYIDGADFLYNKNPAWSEGGGGALALNEAKVSLEGSLFLYNTSPLGGDIFIVDDLDPKTNGSYLSCASSYDSRNSFDESDIAESGSPGHYSNQNCDGFGQGTSYTVESTGNNVYGDGSTYHDIPQYVPPPPPANYGNSYGSSNRGPSPSNDYHRAPNPTSAKPGPAPNSYQDAPAPSSVSYTHLTLPTKRIV